MDDGRVTEVDSIWLGVLMMRASAAGVNGVVAGFIEEGAAASEVSGLAAMEDVTDEEDIGIGVETMMSAGIEGISVWLRNRATFRCLEFHQRKTSSTALR